MKNTIKRTLRRPVLAWAFCALSGAAWAGPGAHGPNGEHLDAPAHNVSASPSAAPRLEAQSELFELVGHLGSGELSVLIDRFATNEPVLRADVEIESGPLKAKARFHEDQGDYAVDDPALLKLLATPGEHPVVITILAGEDSDLLDAVLRVEAGASQASARAQGSEGHPGSEWTRWGLGALVAVVAALAWGWRRRQRGRVVARKVDGGQA